MTTAVGGIEMEWYPVIGGSGYVTGSTRVTAATSMHQGNKYGNMKRLLVPNDMYWQASAASLLPARNEFRARVLDDLVTDLMAARRCFRWVLMRRPA